MMSQGKQQPQRLSITLPAGHYQAVERLALQKRVSLAWVIREAVRLYVETESPLINEVQESNEQRKE